MDLAAKLRLNTNKVREMAIDGQANVGVFHNFGIRSVDEDETSNVKGVIVGLSHKMGDFKGEEASEGPA